VTTFDRRRNILRMLSEQGSVRVSNLARLLDVSEGTIRNDLAALDEEHQLMRVRGGAVTREDEPSRWSRATSNGDNAAAKLRIARWAADLIENGDSVLFDASLTVQSMAQYLKDRRHLTVVTNGLDVGRIMAENPSNTVILIGGILAQDGLSVSGSLAEKFLKDLHIRYAFITCSGCSLDTGLMEFDIHQANLKTQMIRSAQQTIALIDSSKFGKLGLTPFASIGEISHIFTDSAVDPAVVEQLQQRVGNLTICEESTTSSFTRQEQVSQSHYRIGFANLSETIPFAVDVRRGLERAAKEAGNIDLVVGDNQLDREAAVQMAEDLIDKDIDLMIEYQIDETIGGLLMNRFQQAGIPVIAVDIPMVGATYFGVDNHRAGMLAGGAIGEWIAAHWRGEFDVLVMLEEPRAGVLPAMRMQGQLDGLAQALPNRIPHRVHTLDSGNTVATSYSAMQRLLNDIRPSDRIAVLCFNDDAALGALAAARDAGREQQVVIVGQGADRRAREEIRKPGTRFIGSTAFMPEKYGTRLIEVAQKILRGEPVPPAIYTDCVFLCTQNIDSYYSD